jgi:hypothetical protein
LNADLERRGGFDASDARARPAIWTRTRTSVSLSEPWRLVTRIMARASSSAADSESTRSRAEASLSHESMPVCQWHRDAGPGGHRQGPRRLVTASSHGLRLLVARSHRSRSRVSSALARIQRPGRRHLEYRGRHMGRSLARISLPATVSRSPPAPGLWRRPAPVSRGPAARDF